jgi:hypothetical protein
MMVGIALLMTLMPAHAAKFSGRVVVTGEFRESLDQNETNGKKGTTEYYWKLPNGIIPELPPRIHLSKDLAVLLFKKDDAPPKPDEVKTVKVFAGGLEKSVVVTRPGSTIKFQNDSSFTHELFAEGVQAFKPELQSTTSVRAIEFPEEGVFEIRCRLMPNFSAHVVVTSGIDLELKNDGSIAMDLDQGQYTLKVFHAGGWVYKHSFSVEGGRMDPLEIKLKPQKGGAEDEVAKAAEETGAKKGKKAGKKSKK